MSIDYQQLSLKIKCWGQELGFQSVGIADVDLSQHGDHLQQWLAQGFHGDMAFMARNQDLRLNPPLLHPGTVRVISARMNYLPHDAAFCGDLSQTQLGYISRYALGRDYHKLIRKRLKQLGERIQQEVSSLDARPFVDSAPLLERPLAASAGLGWIGKHSLLLDSQQGSWFFLGELLVNLPLPIDAPVEEGCGNCVACLTICPTQAIVAPYVVDARRCISYLTIEHDGVIDEALRPLMGNRIYGCDDCQLVCPWNRQAPLSTEPDFNKRPQLAHRPLLELFNWSEAQFLTHTEGSPIRRIGYRRWLRNVSVALGNGPAAADVIAALQRRANEYQHDPVLREHFDWALQRLQHSPPRNTKTARLIRIVEKGLPRDA